MYLLFIEALSSRSRCSGIRSAYHTSILRFVTFNKINKLRVISDGQNSNRPPPIVLFAIISDRLFLRVLPYLNRIRLPQLGRLGRRSCQCIPELCNQAGIDTGTNRKAVLNLELSERGHGVVSCNPIDWTRVKAEIG